MMAFILYILFALLAISVQATLLHKITRPDLIIILVCFYSVKHGQIKGLAYGALTGLLIDAASGFILGPNILSKALTGFFASFLRQKLFQWNALICAAMIGIFSFADILLVYLCLNTFADISFINRPVQSLLMQVVYTTLAGLVLYPLLNPERESRTFFPRRSRS